jgi:8-oxo-dGTP diphosphatase
MSTSAVINPASVSEHEAHTYRKRSAARGIIYNHEGNIALLHVTQDHYYKLPGGGIEGNETPEEAFIRECQEETGVTGVIVDTLGEIIEYRKPFRMVQTSYCFIAKQEGERKSVSLTDSEKKRGFVCIWTPLSEATQLISQSHATTVEGLEYILPRDTLILNRASTRENGV